MTFQHHIPLSDIRPGDHFDAEIRCHGTKYGIRYYSRRCTLVEIVGQILRVRTATRRDLIAITRDKIRSDHAWGER
jgi:hypothetical protein